MTKNQRSLLLLAALFVLPPVLAWMSMHVWRPAPGKAHGQLLTPTAFQPAAIKTLAGEPFVFSSLHGKWVLLQVIGTECDSTCTQTWHLARQARTAQGREMDRIQRVALVKGNALNPTLDEALLVRGEVALEPGLYVVDPQGLLMMHYTTPPEGKGLVKDLQRLLKASSVG